MNALLNLTMFSSIRADHFAGLIMIPSFGTSHSSSVQFAPGDNHGGHRAGRHGALPHGDNHGGHRAGRHGVHHHGDNHGGHRAGRHRALPHGDNHGGDNHGGVPDRE